VGNPDATLVQKLREFFFCGLFEEGRLFLWRHGEKAIENEAYSLTLIRRPFKIFQLFDCFGLQSNIYNFIVHNHYDNTTNVMPSCFRCKCNIFVVFLCWFVVYNLPWRFFIVLKLTICFAAGGFGSTAPR